MSGAPQTNAGTVIEQHAAQRSALSRRPLHWRRSLPKPGGTREVARRISTHSAPLSAVAVFAIVAIALDWLAVPLKWFTFDISLSDEHGLYRITSEEPSLARAMRLVALLLFVGAGVLGALQPRRARISRPASFLLAAMLAYCGLWTLIGYEPSEYVENLVGTWNPMVFVMCLGIFAGLDRSLWRLMHPLSLFLAYGSMIFGCYYTARYSVMGHFSGVNPMVEFLQLTFWISLCSMVLTPTTARWSSLAPLLPLLSCLPIAMMIGSRSFTVLCAFGMAAATFFALTRLTAGTGKRLVAVAAGTSIVGAGFFWFLALKAPANVDALQHRMFEDTRSPQYHQFFQQVPLWRLIPGLGPNATYRYGDHPDYGHIDNQLIFLAFKLGAPVLLGYCAVVLWPGLRLLFRTNNQLPRRLGVLFVFWTLATLGVSIFHAIIPSPQNLLIVLLAGRAVDLAQSQGEAHPAWIEAPPRYRAKQPRSIGL